MLIIRTPHSEIKVDVKDIQKSEYVRKKLDEIFAEILKEYQQKPDEINPNSRPPEDDTSGGGILSSPSKVTLTSAQHYFMHIARAQGKEGYLTLQDDDQVSSIVGNPTNLINSKKIAENSEKSKNRVIGIFRGFFGNFPGFFGNFSRNFSRIFSGNFRRIFREFFGNEGSDNAEGIRIPLSVVPLLSQDQDEVLPEVSVTLTNAVTSSSERRKRGRPRKATPSLETKRPRGRPRKHPVEPSPAVEVCSAEKSVPPADDVVTSNSSQTESNQTETVTLKTPLELESDPLDGVAAYFEDDEPKGVELKRIERLTLGRPSDPRHLTAKKVWEIYKAYRLSLEDLEEFHRRLKDGGNVSELFDDTILAPIFRLSITFGEVVRLLFSVIPHEPRKYSMFLRDWYSPLVDFYRMGIDAYSVSYAIRKQLESPRFRLNCPRGLVTKASEAMVKSILMDHSEQIVRDRERLLKRVFGEAYEKEALRP